MNESTSPTPPSLGSSWRHSDLRRMPAVSLLVPAGEHDSDLAGRLAAALDQTLPAHEIVVLDSSANGRHFATFVAGEERHPRAVLRYLHVPGMRARDVRRLGNRAANGNLRVLVAPGSSPAREWVENVVAQVRQWLAATVRASTARLTPALALG